MRDLLGHTARSLITTEEYLTDETTGTSTPTAGAYLVAIRDVDHAQRSPSVAAPRGRPSATTRWGS